MFKVARSEIDMKKYSMWVDEQFWYGLSFSVFGICLFELLFYSFCLPYCLPFKGEMR